MTLSDKLRTFPGLSAKNKGFPSKVSVSKIDISITIRLRSLSSAINNSVRYSIFVSARICVFCRRSLFRSMRRASSRNRSISSYIDRFNISYILFKRAHDIFIYGRLRRVHFEHFNTLKPDGITKQDLSLKKQYL